MPLFFKKTLPDGSQLGCWKIEEPEDFFLNKHDLSGAEAAELAPIRGHRRLEWLASRLLLQVLFTGFSSNLTAENRRLVIEKTASGKPFWPSRLDLYFSVSHSGGFVAAVISEKKCGIDWQIFTEKIGRIRSRFLNEKELFEAGNSVEPHFLNIAWSAKEALFKAWGEGGIDFRKHLRLDLSNDSGFVEKEETCLEFYLFHEKWTVDDSDFMLVWVLEK